MPDVNLLPRDQREQERKEIERARRLPKRVDIVLTNPQKEGPLPLKAPKLPKETFWHKLFAKPKAVGTPVHPIVPKAPVLPISSSPSLLPSKKSAKPSIAQSLASVKPPFWARLFSRLPKKVPVATPKAPASPRVPAPAPTPFVKGPNLLQQQPSPSAPKPLAPPAPPTPPKPAVAAPNLATGAHQPLFSPLSKASRVKFTQVKPKEKPKESNVVSLLPAELRPREGDVETKLVITVIAALAIASAIVGGGLFVVKSLRLGAETEFQNIMTQQSGKVAELASRQAMLAEGERIQKKIALVDQLLDAHVYGTKWLRWVEQKTDPGVQWKTVAAQAEGNTVSFSGVGENLLAVARQVMAFRQMAGVKDVKIASATAEGEEGQFGMKIELTLEPFYTEDVADLQDSAKTIPLRRGMFTTTREEALYGQ